MRPTRDTRQLTWFLAWAVVFCDIGTSVYYVPGILYGQVKNATPFFVLLTTGGFILFGLKYIEISWRNPEGGGVVTITTKAFGPMWGCFGGMLITVDYPHHGDFGSRSQNTQSRSSGCSRKTSRNNPDLDRVAQRRRSHRPCGQGARCRHRPDRASRRSAFYHMLRGHALKGPTKKLPRDCHLMICN